MNDLISRQAAIDAFGLSEKTRKYGGDHSGYDTRMLYEIQDVLEGLPSAQPETHEKRTETHACDCISRQAAIAVANRADYRGLLVEDVKKVTDEVVKGLKQLPSAQPKQTASNYIESLPTSPLLVGKMPPAQPEIIRCKDCKFYRKYGCQRAFVYPEPEDFCSRAERGTDGRD